MSTYAKRKYSLNIGGNNYTCIAHTFVISLNKSPSLNLSLAMGKPLFRGDDQDPSKIKEGDIVSFQLETVGDKAGIVGMVGYVVHTAISMVSNDTSGSGSTYSIKVEHELSNVGTLPVISRAFIGDGAEHKAPVRDLYRDLILSGKKKGSRNPIRNVLTGRLVKGGLANLKAATGVTSLPEFVIAVMIELYKTEASFSMSTSRVSDEKALSELTKLKDAIEGGDLASSVGNNDAKSGFLNGMVKNMSEGWALANPLQLLTHTLSIIFFALAPDSKGNIAIRQDCPVFVAEDTTVKSEDILTLQAAEAWSANPVKGIRLVIPKSNSDALAKSGIPHYVQYPEEGDGMYEYINTNKFKLWFMYTSAVAPRKVKEKKAVATVNNSKGVPFLETKDPDTIDVVSELERKKRLYRELGRALYAVQKWRPNTLTIHLADTTKYIRTGDICKVDLSDNKLAQAAGIPPAVYYGQIQTASYTGSYKKEALTVTLSNVRSDSENKEFGLKEMPLYASK